MAYRSYRSLIRPESVASQGSRAQSRANPRHASSGKGVPLFLRKAVARHDEHQPTSVPFPHAPAISAATGVSAAAFPAVHDPSIQRRCGVPAYTDGSIAYFASRSPELRIAAHEAAHVAQHSGLTRDAGLGPERHAHAIARATAAGASARHLIGSNGARVAPDVRHYTEIPEASQTASGQWKVGSDAKVGDQGRTVTTEYQHEAFADPALIRESNKILKVKGSGIRIEPGAAGPSGLAPDGSGFKTTVAVDYRILSDEDNEEFYADCGVSSREVMGKMGTDTEPKGIFYDAGGDRVETARSYNPADFRDEIYLRGGLGVDRASAHAAYNALSAGDKEAFDKKHGINQYATPGVGEAFTRRRDDSLGGTGFNFHWGGVIMLAGGDRVTFENFTKGEGYRAKDDDWYFETYGPPTKPGQTWHEQWKDVGGAGKGTTMAAATSADPAPFIPAAEAMSTADLIKRYRASGNEGEKMALESEMGGRWMKVTVVVAKAQEGTDEVYVRAEHGGRDYETGALDMTSGRKNTFWISLKALAPVSGKIMVKVYDSDVFSDDMISIIGFEDPFTPRTDNRPWDGAEYHTTVEFDR